MVFLDLDLTYLFIYFYFFLFLFFFVKMIAITYETKSVHNHPSQKKINI